ncbi:uncharacterized protein LOC128683002 [Plodia interpunctella]|uniref:uncharacterized protein LOC128683002 n=1 Tax=Plodia interpunctella TaxID=58824 RepID=UPI0023685CBF|nr:uncharacterized protein LOC128683002 [Plodia interpunctella]
MISRLYLLLIIYKVIEDISALVELPQVQQNDILKTDYLIRETTNNLFSIIKLKVNEYPALKQYSLIQNYLASASLYEYSRLIEVAKLTRVDKTKINNETKLFMAILNGILDEDIKHDLGTEDEFVIEHIEGVLKNLNEYTDSYNYDKSNTDIIIADILNIIEHNDTFTENYYNDTSDTKNLELADGNGAVIHDSNEFWAPNARRIFHGRKASIRDFPFMASIQIFNHFQCAGSIIKSDLIITAASCLQMAWNNRFYKENPAFLSARVGSTLHNSGGENVPILEIYFHPEYDPRTLVSNLCLLRLRRLLNLKISRRLKKIEIDKHTNPLPMNTNGITIVGWGARHRTSTIMEPFLAFAVLDFYPLEECKEVYSRTYVKNNNFCAGFISQGSGACNRDIGGPGITRGVLAGVVSFGSPTCGTPDAPTVFTKLGYYKEWIEDIMQQNVVTGKQQTTTTLGSSRNIFKIPYVSAKTTFRVTPLSSRKKTIPSIVNEEALKQQRNNKFLREFIDKLTHSERLNKLLEKIKENADVVKRTPVTNSLVTTQESTLDTDIESSIETILPENLSTVMGIMEPDNKTVDIKRQSHFESLETYFEEHIKYPVEAKVNKSMEIEVIRSKNSNVHNKIIDTKRRSTEIENEILELINELKEKRKQKLRLSNRPFWYALEKDPAFEKKRYFITLNNSSIEDSSDTDTNADSAERGLAIETNLFIKDTILNKRSIDRINYLKELNDAFSEALKEELEYTINTTLTKSFEKIESSSRNT